MEETKPASEITASSPTPPQPLPQPMEQIDIEYFSKVKLRVARVEQVEPLPKSKKLLRLQIDLGPDLGKRQILAGIAAHYTPESLVGKHIVVVANLKPATLMGEQSQGMLLAASASDGSGVFVLSPEHLVPPGSEVR